MKKRSSAALVVLSVVALVPFPIKLDAQEVSCCNSVGVLSYNLTIPSFELESQENGQTLVLMDGASYGLEPGYPMLPTLSYTFALPPGTRAEEIEVSGSRIPLEGFYIIEPQPVPLPVGYPPAAFLKTLYEKNKQSVYSEGKEVPLIMGKGIASSCRREYSLVTVVLYPFSYDALDGKLSFSTSLSVTIHYSPSEDEELSLVKEFLSKGTIYSDVPEHIYNKDQAREWYRPGERLLAAPRMLILTTEALLPNVQDYVTWRESCGFTIGTVTKEEILSSSVEGVDTQEKIRNWLRQNAADYDCLFIIGHYSDIPMRTLHGYGDDPSADPSWYYPAVSDIYYGDLSKRDASSWDSDGDGYYGEVLANGSGPTVDNPDIEMELNVGRINSSIYLIVENALDRIRLFESLNDPIYKKGAVVSAGIPFYKTVDGEGLDGAIFMEYLQDADILDRSLTTRLYEKGGDMPSVFECDLPETRENLVPTLKDEDVGIFVEYNHGSPTEFARFIVHDTNKNGYFESGEEEWFTCLSTSDAWKLNTEHPNVAFLMSCLNGRPEETLCLAEALIQNGSVAAVAHTRVSYSGGWHTPANGGFECLYYEDIKAFVQDSVPLGEAVSSARPVLRAKEPEWFFLNCYTHSLYGDPTLTLYRYTPLDVCEESFQAEPVRLSVNANSTVQFSLPEESFTRVEMWDITGRRVKTLVEGWVKSGPQIVSWNSDDLASGTYFITLKTDKLMLSTKAVVVK